MAETLNIGTSVVVYGDSSVNSNPKRRFVDWTRVLQGMVVQNPKSEKFVVDPGATFQVFDGTRATSIDGSTIFAVTASSLDPSRFRFTATGGTAPAFRTDRGLALSGVLVTVAINQNGSATFTLGSGTWGSASVGDTLFIPGISTGDVSGPFSVLNEGSWKVIGVSGAVLTATRPSGVVFQGVSEAKSPTANAQLSVFSAAGVQPNDKVDISSGFSAGTQKTFQIVAVTPTWFEVSAGVPLALDTAVVPGAAGIAFYKFSKQYVRIEADQECVVQANYDTGNTNRVSPIAAGDPESPGWYEKFGPCWNLSVKNRTAAPLNINVISVE